MKQVETKQVECLNCGWVGWASVTIGVMEQANDTKMSREMRSSLVFIGYVSLKLHNLLQALQSLSTHK